MKTAAATASAPTTTSTPGEAMDIPLNMLRHGHDPLAGPTINARCTGRRVVLEQMEAMLREQGQLYRLLVVENPTGSAEGKGLFFVFDGNRRLAALQIIHKADPQALIPCEVFPDSERALEYSLAANTSTPMHPVDRHRALVEIARREKLRPAQLAARFGLPQKEIDRSLALGALADEVLDAWLKGDITAETAAAFTLAADKNQQARTLPLALKHYGGPSPSWVRDQLVGKKKDLGKLVAFIGVDAYRKAGGKVREDLFTTSHMPDDPALAKKMADIRIETIAAELMVAGWAWALPASKMPDRWAHDSSWGRLPIPKVTLTVEQQAERDALKRECDRLQSADADWQEVDVAEERVEAFDAAAVLPLYSPDLRARAGVVLEISETGELLTTAGVVKPAEKKKVQAEVKKKEKAKKAKAVAAGAAPEPASISQNLAQRLSKVLTTAAADVVTGGETLMVLRLLYAGLEANGIGPVCIEHKGMGHGDREEGADFADALETARGMNEAKLITALSRFAGMALDLQDSRGDRVLDGTDEATPLVNFLPAKPLNLALRKHFDAADFFANAPAAFALQALKEMGIPAPKGGKKAQLAEAAAEAAVSRGWLPIALRIAAYDGPGAKAKAPAKAKPKKKGGRK